MVGITVSASIGFILCVPHTKKRLKKNNEAQTDDTEYRQAKTPELLSRVNDSCRLERRLTLNTFMCGKQLAMVLKS